VPEGIAREYANLLLERRRGLVALVPIALLARGLNPTDPEIAAFYRTNRLAFTISERRIIKYALIGPEQVTGIAPATEAEIAAVYRNSPLSYAARETRTIQSIVLPSQQAAQAFAARVRGGASFVDAAAQAGFSAGDVTFANQSRAQFGRLTNAQIAAAAFAAAQGSVAGPFRSELGFHVVRVEAIARTPGRPLEAVRGEIAAAIEARKRADALNALVSRIEDRLSDGASFEEAARAEHLAIVTTPAITSSGQPHDDSQWVMPLALRPLLGPAFEIDADDPEPVVEPITGTDKFALIGIDRVIPAAPDRGADQCRHAGGAGDRFGAAATRAAPGRRSPARGQPGRPAGASRARHPVLDPAGPGAGGAGGAECRLVRGLPPAAHARRGRDQPDADPVDPDRVRHQCQRRARPAIRPRRRGQDRDHPQRGRDPPRPPADRRRRAGRRVGSRFRQAAQPIRGRPAGIARCCPAALPTLAGKRFSRPA
jgi:hypothetical protein